jgi:hypothetical protein
MTTLPPYYVDASTLEGRFCVCPRSYEYYRLRRREGNTPGRHIGRNFGTLVHRALADHYRGKNITPSEYYAWDSEDRGIPFDDYRDLSYFTKLLTLYRETYPVEPFEVVTFYNTETKKDEPLVEKPFAFPLGSVETPSGILPVIWTGVIDLAVRYPDGAVWVFDHKTSKVAGGTYWAQFQNSTAQRGYVRAVERALGTPVRGFIINALFVREPTKTGKGQELARQMYPLDWEWRPEWETNTLQSVAEVQDCTSRGTFPMHTNACVGKYGMCEYLDICQLPPESREAVLMSNAYKPVTWDPLTSI